MGNRSIHPDTHKAAVEGSFVAELPDHTFRQTLGGISTRTVSRAKKRFHETGTYAFDTSRKGRRRKLDRSIVNHISWLATQDPSITIVQAQDALREINIDVHVAAIGRTLRQEGYTFRKLVKVARERSECQRADLLLRMAQYSVEQLVWTDETHSDERDTVRSYGWGVRGDRAEVEAPFVRCKR